MFFGNKTRIFIVHCTANAFGSKLFAIAHTAHTSKLKEVQTQGRAALIHSLRFLTTAQSFYVLRRAALIQFQPILRLEQLRGDGLHEKYQHQRPFCKFSPAIRVSESLFCLAKFGFYEEKSSIKSQKHGAASTFKQPRKVMRSRNVWASYVKDAKFQKALKTVTMILESIGIQQSVFS